MTPDLSKLIDRLQFLCSPGAEAMSDSDRINAFVKAGDEAVERIINADLHEYVHADAIAEAKAELASQKHTLDRLTRANHRMLIVLNLCYRYFKELADAEYRPGVANPIGNEEMRIYTEIEEALHSPDLIPIRD